MWKYAGETAAKSSPADLWSHPTEAEDCFSAFEGGDVDKGKGEKDESTNWRTVEEG